MIKIMFVCHGNICRSPMAELVMRDIIKKAGMNEKIHIASSATSREEIGNPGHPGTRKKLAEYGLSVDGKTATQITKEDYKNYDYIIVMDSFNLRNLQRIIGSDIEKKVYMLLDFADGGDIADPWYTGNLDRTYDDILKGCKGLFNKITTEDL